MIALLSATTTLLRSFFLNTERIRDAMRYSSYVLAPRNPRFADYLRSRVLDMTTSVVAEANRRGLDYFDAGEYASAEAEFRSVVYEDSADYQGLRGLAVSLERQGEFGEATYYYTTALSHYPNDWDLRSYRIVCMLDEGRTKDALTEYDRFIEDAGSEGESGAFHLATQTVDAHPDRALALLRAVKADQSDSAAMLALLAFALWRNDQDDESRIQASRALGLDPNDALANHAMAVLLAPTDPTEAMNHAKRVMQASSLEDGTLAYALNTLGWVHYMGKDHEASEKAYSEALDIAPDMVFARFNLALNRLVWGDINGSRSAYEIAVRQTESMPPDAAELELRMAAEDLIDVKEGEVDEGDAESIRNMLESARTRRALEVVDS